jgi:predicted small secreted protein
MKKTFFLKRTSKNWLSSFSANLLGVIIGIAITFMVSGWISSRNEKKDIQRYLEMVKMELEDNLPIVQGLSIFYEQAQNFSNYLLTIGKQENLQADSLKKYENVIRNTPIINYQSGAYEILKSSGTMRLIRDKELLKSIIDSYSTLEYAQKAGNREMEIKSNKLFDVITVSGIDYNLLPLMQKPENKPIFNYFSIYTGVEGNFQRCEQQIKKTLELF